ncbi:hypothetical protein D3C86_1411630 [compost metagenome]
MTWNKVVSSVMKKLNNKFVAEDLMATGSINIKSDWKNFLSLDWYLVVYLRNLYSGINRYLVTVERM